MTPEPGPAPRACPTLLTERLRLRAHRPTDLPDELALWSDERVVGPMGAAPMLPEEVWRRLLSYGGLWPFIGYGYWRIEALEDGRYLGAGGIADFHRGLGPDFDGAPEAGWALAPHAHGQGVAREAMEAILAWADAALGAPRTVCLISPTNAPSLRLAERLGFRRFRDQDFRGKPTVLLDRARAQLKTARTGCRSPA